VIGIRQFGHVFPNIAYYAVYLVNISILESVIEVRRNMQDIIINILSEHARICVNTTNA